MKLKIVEIDPIEDYHKSWLFIQDDESVNYSYRWAICFRQPDWWGVIATFEATNEIAIDRIAEEMKLAKEAIKIIKTMVKN